MKSGQVPVACQLIDAGRIPLLINCVVPQVTKLKRDAHGIIMKYIFAEICIGTVGVVIVFEC